MGVLIKLIRQLNQALGHTSIIVSHDINETLSIADYVYLIADGALLAHGTPDELVNQADPQVRQFLHGEADGPVPFHFPAPDLATQLLGGGQ